MRRFKLIIGLLVCMISSGAFSQTSLFDQQMQIGFEEKQGQYVALDTRLVNEKGDTVLLRDVISKATILNLVYYRCPGTCSPIMWGISRFIDAIDLKPGEDYQILTISFDPSERIDLAIEKKASYLSTMTKKEAGKGWEFFVSDSAEIAKLTQSAGFRFKLVNNQYVHPAGLIALAPDGKITRYLRGIDFLPFDIKITLVEAANGKIGPSINRLLSVCYSYDEQGNQYVFNVTRVSAIVISFFIILLFAFLALTRKRNKKSA
jgi:protein SCO1/2